MKSETTVRRWLKELEREPASEFMEAYRQGMTCALRCVLGPDWSEPVKFVQMGSKWAAYEKGRSYLAAVLAQDK
jgi:hypothetical protein